MRHRINKLKQLNTGAKKKNVFVRNLLTSFVKTGRITTTPKRAKVLKAETDAFFSKLVKTYSRYNTEAESKRECIKIVKATIFGEAEGKKVILEWLPKYLGGDKRTSYVMSYKLGVRKGDSAEKIMLKLV
ncbi:MAG TPA: L17 family ribosomal protein [Candidatus Absconditabacterales bacterium]|nr:L17 family ribosomal protein [Candidatus Absconditabacterales bacterium]HOQ79138.1 L17 family ribosomal protein [Candidatus Absconditabacterales bacterium]HPK28207.1 L17 family ribosomal protein [Candidatus Absconditabacterales bacterium]